MNDLNARVLGRTGLVVTRLAFGANEVRGDPPFGPEFTDDEAGRILNDVLDVGINFIDTAMDYGFSEERIGKHISHRRDEYLLESKCGCVPGLGRGHTHLHTDENIRAGVEHSLRTMRTDYLDVLLFHRNVTRSEAVDGGALEAMLDLKEQGKVRFIGVSGLLPNLPEQIAMDVFDVFQIPYSALQREHEKLISEASATGAGIVVRGGVARAVPTDWDGRTYWNTPTALMRSAWEGASLDELLGGMTRIEFMLRFTLSHPDLDCVIIGTRDPDHLRDNVATAQLGPLPQEVIDEAKRRLDAYLAGQAPSQV